MPAYPLNSEHIYVALQRGDEEMSPLKPKEAGLQDGMIGNLIDPLDSGWDKQVVISEYNQGETCWVELPRAAKPTVLKYMAQVGDDPMSKDFRRSTDFVDFKALAPYVDAQVPDFLTKVHEHKKYVPVLKLNGLPGGAVKPTKDINLVTKVAIPDVGQITSGNYTIGPGAADYPTYGGAGGFAAALGNLTGDLTGTLNGSIVETAIASYTIDLGAFTLLLTSDSPHYGDPTAGHQVTCNSNVNFIDCQQEGAAGTMRVQNFRVVCGGTHNTATIVIRIITTATTIYFADLLFDKGGKGGNATLNCNDPQPVVCMYNCLFWDASLQAFRFNQINNSSIIENCSAYGNGTGFEVGAGNPTFRNCASYGNTTDFVGIGTSTGRYNRSSDLSAADGNWAAALGNTTGAVVANDVQSVNDADATFFDITAGGPLDGAGEANAIAERTACIRNRAVPGPNGTSVGVAEIVTPTPVVSGREPFWESRISNRIGSRIG